ncbi:hypothetical protein ACQY0O_008427 [Thecaphora frezii]
MLVALGSLVVVLLFVLWPTRLYLLDAVARVYCSAVHHRRRHDLHSFLLSSHSHPFPETSSPLSTYRAKSVLAEAARSRGFRDDRTFRRFGIRHERTIDWSEPGVPRPGDLIESWDRVAEWDRRCIHPHKLQSLRLVGDTLADAALLQVLHSNVDTHDTDVLGQIYRLGSAANDVGTKDGTSNACATFWSAIDRRPPPGAGALSLDWYARRAKRNGEAPIELPRWPTSPSTNDQDEPPLRPWRPASGDSAVERPATADLEELQAEADVLRRGQDVFYKYAGPMLLSLLHFSLAGGFASPRITEVLRQTAYLVPGSHKERTTAATARQKGDDTGTGTEASASSPGGKQGGGSHLPRIDKARADRTWSRLLETTQFVLDVMESVESLRPPCYAMASASACDPVKDHGGPESGGQAWQSAARVRLLHTAVRERVLRSASRSTRTAGTSYDVEKNGVPINQEDLLATLCSFSVAPLASLQAMGLRPSLQEREDYIALWRHVGFYMGIEPALLRSCFSDAATADRALWCAILHLFGQLEVTQHGGGDDDDNEAETCCDAPRRIHGPTIPVLIACANRPPFHTPLAAHFAIARHLLGPQLSDSLGIPATDPVRTLITDIAFLGIRIPVWFGQIYRRGWERRRRELARPLLRRLIVWSLGNRRTRFEMPAPKSDKEKDAEAGAKVGTQSDKLLDVAEDKAEDARLVRQWSWLMREMVTVCILAALVACTMVVYSAIRSGLIFW